MYHSSSHADLIHVDDASLRVSKHWHSLDQNLPPKQIQCDLCPRYCKLHEGQRGLCYVRGRINDQIVLTSYGRSSGFAVDPIEKKPLNHFFPGSKVLSFGTAGCNLACKFCQNWDISKSRDMDRLMSHAQPEEIAAHAKALDCKSVAYTYNDPTIFHEYAIDTALACKALGIKNVAVTAGYMCPAPRAEFFAHMDATNIDLKAFTEDFYWQQTGSHLEQVLETIKYVRHETKVWLELTTLLIPGLNDSDPELTAMCQWIQRELGSDVPLHFSAFHPDHKLRDRPRTPQATLTRARNIALEAGLSYVYTGNVHDPAGSSTYCKVCHTRLIERDWYRLGERKIRVEQHTAYCQNCGQRCAGHY